MIQDRRKQPRHPVLIKATVTIEYERTEMVCTELGPAGAFFATRSSARVDQIATLVLRAGTLGSPLVELAGTIVRTNPAGSAWPQGFALRWKHARCEHGAEPLIRLLQNVLRMADVRSAELGDDRVAHFDFSNHFNPPVLSQRSRSGSAIALGTALANPARGRASGSTMQRSLGSWSPAVVAPAGGASPGVPASEGVSKPIPAMHEARAQVSAARSMGGVPAPPPASPYANQPRTAASGLYASVSAQARSPTASHAAAASASAVRPPGGPYEAAPLAAVLDEFVPPPPVPPPPVPRRPRVPDSEFRFQPQSAAAPEPDLPVPRQPSGSVPTADLVGYEPSGMFDPRESEPSVAIGGRRGENTSDIGSDGASQSWPVYALAPGERRPSSRFGYTNSGVSADELLDGIRPPDTGSYRTAESGSETTDAMGPGTAPGEGPITALSPILPSDAVAARVGGRTYQPQGAAAPEPSAAQSRLGRSVSDTPSATARAQSLDFAIPTRPEAPRIAGARRPVDDSAAIVPYKYGVGRGPVPASSESVRAIAPGVGRAPAGVTAAFLGTSPGAANPAAAKPGLGRPGGPTPVIGTTASAPGARTAAAGAKPDPKVMRPVDLPITYQRKNLLIPARLVGLGQVACAIVSEADSPNMDEQLTVNLAIPVAGVWRTVYLNGKLLQSATETDQGRRFVMHIEKAEDGRHEGAFRNYLVAIQAA
ncbi:MAG: hypothetical protein EXR79_06650 [Myxococcales bacterium]|nr:hypothetical protein [Myxococcales bacterium]